MSSKWFGVVTKFYHIDQRCSRNILEKVFKNGPSRICGRQPLFFSASADHSALSFFKGCRPKILFGTWSHFYIPMLKI